MHTHWVHDSDGQTPNQDRVGLVLGAGGEAGGAFIRGALQALAELAGWHPWSAQTVIGTSIGALRGARLEAAPASQPFADTATRLRQIASQLDPLPPLASDRIVVPGRRVGGRLVALAAPAGKQVANYPVGQPPYHPGLHTVAVRRWTGSRHVTRLAGSTQASRVLYSSAAIPSFSAPVELEGNTYVDGAVYSPTNADLVTPSSHDLLIVIAPMVTRDGGPWLGRTHRALLVAELAAWRRAAKPTIVVAPRSADLTSKSDHVAYASIAYDQVERAVHW